MNIEDFKTQELVKKYNFRFSKSLGQNFLIDNSVLEDIVEGANISKDDMIIEIGPGVGTLTVRLLEAAKKVISIELDSDLIPILEGELGGYSNFQLIHNDVLKVDLKEIINGEKNVKLVANLPYYVTTPIIVKLLKEKCEFDSLTIMIQKEVAERMDAEPNSKAYGALSLLVQYYCKTEIIRKVLPSSFLPKPKVESIVIKLDRLKEPAVCVKDEKLMFDIIRNSFNMRRKTLWNTTKFLGLSKENQEDIFKKANIDCKRRGETLSLEEFRELADAVFDLKSTK